MFSYKLFFFLIVIITLSDAGLTPDQLTALMHECKDKVGATEEDMAAVVGHQMPETRGSLCMLSCVKKTLGMMNEDNTLNVSRIGEVLTPLKERQIESFNFFMTVANTCSLKVVSDPDACQASKNIMQCFVDEAGSDAPDVDLMGMLTN